MRSYILLFIVGLVCHVNATLWTDKTKVPDLPYTDDGQQLESIPQHVVQPMKPLVDALPVYVLNNEQTVPQGVLDSVFEDSVENLIPFNALAEDQTASVKKDVPTPTNADTNDSEVPVNMRTSIPIIDWLSLVFNDDFNDKTTSAPSASGAPESTTKTTNKLDWLKAAFKSRVEQHQRMLSTTTTTPVLASVATTQLPTTTTTIAAASSHAAIEFSPRAFESEFVERAISPMFAAQLLGRALVGVSEMATGKDDDAQFEKTKFRWSKLFAAQSETANDEEENESMKSSEHYENMNAVHVDDDTSAVASMTLPIRGEFPMPTMPFVPNFMLNKEQYFIDDEM